MCLQEIVDWFNAIRAARFHYLQVAFPGAPDTEVSKPQHTYTKVHNAEEIHKTTRTSITPSLQASSLYGNLRFCGEQTCSRYTCYTFLQKLCSHPVSKE